MARRRMAWAGVTPLALAAVLAGCGGTSGSGGASEVSITGEELQTTGGNLCSVKGHATNVGNLTVSVRIDWDAKNATGDVIGASEAFFEIAPFSNFDFAFTKNNQLGQPSSGVFSNGLACSGISSFRRTSVDVSH